MTRKLLAFSALLFCLIYWSCQKNEPIFTQPKFQDPIVTGAIDYLKTEITEENFKNLDFSSIQTLKDSGATKGISISSKNKADHKFVFIQKTGGGYIGNWVEVENRDSLTTGILTTTSFDGYLKTQVTFLNGAALKIIKTDHGETTTTLIRYKKDKALRSSSNETSNKITMRVQSSEATDDENWVSLPPVTVIANLNYSPVIMYSIYWISPTPTFIYSYTPLPQSSGSGGSNNSYSLNLLSGHSAIGDIQDYFKCFTNVAGSSNKYRVTICVDQPNPGTRTAWNLSSTGVGGSSSGANPVNVGHTFLILTEETPTGTITRNVGFYPQDYVSPASPVDKGVLNNNEQHLYNIALTVDVNSSQFFNVQNFISQVKSSGQNYDLDNYNCTSFGIKALMAGDVYLNSTIGSWPGGSGNNPGDLGEDIRTMTLNSNMIRSTMQYSHPNEGNCYY